MLIMLGNQLSTKVHISDLGLVFIYHRIRLLQNTFLQDQITIIFYPSSSKWWEYKFITTPDQIISIKHIDLSSNMLICITITMTVGDKCGDLV